MPQFGHIDAISKCLLNEVGWDLMPVAGIDQLHAIQWKLINIRKMDKKKQKESLRKLQAALGL